MILMRRCHIQTYAYNVRNFCEVFITTLEVLAFYHLLTIAQQFYWNCNIIYMTLRYNTERNEVLIYYCKKNILDFLETN